MYNSGVEKKDKSSLKDGSYRCVNTCGEPYSIVKSDSNQIRH